MRHWTVLNTITDRELLACRATQHYSVSVFKQQCVRQHVDSMRFICRLQCGASLGCSEMQTALFSLGSDHGLSHSISSTGSKCKENMGQADSETTEYVFSYLSSYILVSATLGLV